jgi:hypothetical protein
MNAKSVIQNIKHVFSIIYNIIHTHKNHDTVKEKDEPTMDNYIIACFQKK